MGRSRSGGQVGLAMGNSNHSKQQTFRIIAPETFPLFYTSVAISQLKCLVYAYFVAEMSKMAFTRFGGQIWLDMHQWWAG